VWDWVEFNQTSKRFPITAQGCPSGATLGHGHEKFYQPRSGLPIVIG
jgi:hypothetical protein